MRLMTGNGCGVWKRMPAFERSTMRLSMVLPPKVNRSGNSTAIRGSRLRSVVVM
jgi:hypothetical protein